jgi:hypothetical protein
MPLPNAVVGADETYMIANRTEDSMKPNYRWLFIVIALLMIVPLAAAQSETPPAPDKTISKANILVTVRIGKIEGTERVPVKSYSLIVADGTNGSKLLSGQRVPFPAGPGDAAEAEGGFIYRNLGFSSEVRAWIVDTKTIKLMAKIEDSRLLDAAAGGPPIVETRQLDVNAILTDGVPLELTRAEGITDQSGFVEVEAEILR